MFTLSLVKLHSLWIQCEPRCQLIHCKPRDTSAQCLHHRYSALDFNCFDYVLAHVNAIGYAGVSSWTKSTLTHSAFGPGIRAAEQYAALLKLVQRHNGLWHSGGPFSCSLTSSDGSSWTVEAQACLVCYDYEAWRARLAKPTEVAVALSRKEAIQLDETWSQCGAEWQ